MPKTTIKHCVGPIIYTLDGKIFLMTSKKWGNGTLWIVPGGAIKKDKKGNSTETEEEALRREIREELRIELDHVEYIKEKIKPAGSDFEKPDVEFHYIDFIAQAVTTTIVPNEEIDQCGWFTIKEAKHLHLMDSTREFINSCEERILERIRER